MPARIIDGREVAARMRAELKDEALRLAGKGVTPGLGVILVGDDPASRSYVTAKEQACAETGLFSDDNRLPASASRAELLELVGRMNNDDRIHGILVQLPLPRHIRESEVIAALYPSKDVDGFHPVNVGKMLIGEEDALLPCTPHGVVQLLVRSGVRLDGAEIVIVGRSNIVGKPLAAMLMQKSATGNATVTVCHTRTRDLASHTRRADIIVAAAGKPAAVTADMVREGAVVIDVGVNRVKDPAKKSGFRLAGDVDFDAVKEKASLITPVPGGVGPMTITMLLHNTILAAKRSIKGG